MLSIINGYIQVKQTTGGGMQNGVPVPVTTTLGDPIPANISKSKSDHKGTYIDGKFVQVQATILIDPQPPTFSATTKRIVVTDNMGNQLGDFEIQDITYLDVADVTQITV
nr:hypothetical protein [uncultured Prevotella sp.]